MATKPFLRATIAVLSFPFIVLSRVAELLDSWKVRDDINECLTVVDACANNVPTRFVDVLIAAEDHRNMVHAGVDPLAMIRAAIVRLKLNQTEGASTMEQQLVRTIMRRYEHSLSRKLKEQSLAIAVCRKRPKAQLAAAYLSIAYYGSGRSGIAALKELCGNDLQLADARQIIGAIARLKYPQPVNPSLLWRHKIDRRILYIARRMRRRADQASMSTTWIGELNRPLDYHPTTVDVRRGI